MGQRGQVNDHAGTGADGQGVTQRIAEYGGAGVVQISCDGDDSVITARADRCCQIHARITDPRRSQLPTFRFSGVATAPVSREMPVGGHSAFARGWRRPPLLLSSLLSASTGPGEYDALGGQVRMG